MRLSGELDATRDAMRRLLLNGAGDKPDIPFAKPARSPGGKSKSELQSNHPNALKAADAEAKIIEVLRSTPGLRTTQIAKQTHCKVNTTTQRLQRMKDRGVIERLDDSGWTASA